MSKWPDDISDSRRKRKPTTRLSGFVYKGNYTYFITICVYNGERIFTDNEVVKYPANKLEELAEKKDFSLLCYCFMPDHLHFLCTGDDEAELIPFVRIYKSVTAFNYKRLYGNRLWQRGYYDRVLRKSDDKYFAVEYILDNPVRAGLMKEAKDYPFSKSLIE